MFTNVSLANYSTMRLGGKAKYLVDITDAADIPFALDWASEKNLPAIMIGGGSNIVWSDKGYAGLVMVNKIKGFKITELDKESSYVTVGAGEDWDKVVARTVKADLHGIEALSLIPGTAGGTPIQNVGAYGQEIADTLVSLEAYDAREKQFVTILAEACDFSYRNSRFKSRDKGRFFITSLHFHLTTDRPKPPFYPALQNYLDHLHIKKFTPQIIREVVIAIRRSKLPDPKKIANNGSFFGNPIVTTKKFEALSAKYPDIPGWPTHDGTVKTSAAWLVEKVGFKNFHDKRTGMATWPKQSLVLVNEKAEHTADLIQFRNRIVKDVKDTFGITLQQEPELL